MRTSSFRRNRRKAFDSINVVPYIDVMLVLLIIFMATAPAFLPQVINLPSVGRADEVLSVPIQVLVRNDKQFTLKLSPEEERTFPSVNALIDEIYRSSTSGRSIVIEADKGIIYDEVIKVMEALKKANIGQIGLLVKPS